MYTVEPIATLHSPFKEKFGLPRQPGLITSANAEIVFHPPYASKESLEGLEGFSHIWITFIFDQSLIRGWRAKVRPPRLGGNEKIGVFATRSPFRPNFIGQSLVALKSISLEPTIKLIIECPDIVDQTPIIDIKPYLPYCDTANLATTGYVDGAPDKVLTVTFSETSLSQLEHLKTCYPDLKLLISETLSYDPRPSYRHHNDPKEYAFRLYDLDVRFQVSQTTALVTRIDQHH